MAHNDFKRYVWLISQLQYSEEVGGMSFKDLDEAWQDSPLNPKEKPLPRRTFHNHIDAIKEIFGISIVQDKGKYHLSYLEGDDAKKRQKDLMALLSLNDMADRLKGMKNRILYEEPMVIYPGCLDTVVRAMQEGKMLHLLYRKHGDAVPTTRLVAPYGLKLFKRRWYLLGKEDKELKTFCLDMRTRGLRISDKSFRMPKSLDPAEYFQDVYGIFKSEPKHVLVKTFGGESEYWRSAPIHLSQKEEATGEDYAIFSLWVGTDGWELMQELLSKGNRIEVLEPESLRREMAVQIQKMKDRYAEFWQNEDGGLKDSSDICIQQKSPIMNHELIPTWDTQAASKKAAKGSFGTKGVLVDVYKNNNEIFAAGCYRTESGDVVTISGPDDPMLKGTKVYFEQFRLGKFGPIAAAGTETSVMNEDCLKVAHQMQEEGLNPAVLNLADCYTACGWYPRGSRAQEESICRVTTLSRSLYQYYTENMARAVNISFKGKGYPMDYHFGGIYSPEVTVFRDSTDHFRLMEEPYKVSVISVAALNFRERDGKPARDGQYRSADGGFTPEGLAIMQDKIRTIYRIALFNGHDSIVLGAFGCGAFRLRSDLVAQLFHDILEEDEFFGRFKDVRFAILEHGKASETGRNGRFAPFYELFK